MLSDRQNNTEYQKKVANSIANISLSNMSYRATNKHYLNVQQGFITIPEDRLEKFARYYADTMQSSFVWTLFGIWISLFTALVGIEYEKQHKLYFFFIFVLSIISYRIYLCIKEYFFPPKDRYIIETPEKFVEVCKKNSIEQNWT